MVLPDGGTTLGERLDDVDLVEAMVTVHLQLGVGADDPAVVRPRDAYLEVLGDLATHAELVEELELACRVAKAGRALGWDRALRMRGGGEAGEFADAPMHALGSLLSDSWIAAV